MSTTKLNIPEVKETRDYDKFKYIASNRTIYKAHVNQLIKSFEENPELIGTRPILVNKYWEVVDGQHRLQACEALGLPVLYIQASDLDIGTAQLMNALQRPWNVMDYAHSYRLSGNPEYKKFLDYMDAYKLPATVLMAYLAGGVKHRLNKDFREGKFQVGDEAVAQDKLQKLQDFAGKFKFWNDYNFAMAVLTILSKVDKYDHKRMLGKLELTTITRQPSRRDYLRELEMVYNYSQAADKITRFF